MTKICKTCNIEKDLNEFYFRKDSRKYREECKRCFCGPINQLRPVNVFKENKDKIIDLYKTERKTLEEISDIYNISKDVLKWHLKKVLKLESDRKRKREINETFFEKIDTEEKAYFLGLLAADGCNNQESNQISLGLHPQDGYIVTKLSLLVLNKNRVYYRKPQKSIFKSENNRIINSSGQIVFRIQNPTLSGDLASLGIVSRKSLVLDFPNNNQVPNSLIHHFIRGYFDGDGCISRRFNHGAARWTITILSSKMFCQKACEIIKSILNLNNINTKPTNSKIYKIEFGGNRKVKIFLDWLYKDSTIFLKRKYEKYLELFNDLKRIDNRLNNTLSKYNNITYDKSRHKWVASIRINKKTKYLGRFQNEDVAYQYQQGYLKELQSHANEPPPVKMDAVFDGV